MSEVSSCYDVAVIGAGIAGASVAAHLARDARVVLIEQESQPGYHTTGRSAAIFSPVYGPPAIRALTRASHAFFMQPPDSWDPVPLLTPIHAAFIARADQLSSLDALHRELGCVDGLERLSGTELESRVSLLRSGYAAQGLWDCGTSKIDVSALHQGFLGEFKRAGGRLLTRFSLSSLQRCAGVWRLCGAGAHGQLQEVRASIIVNASGAWADAVGQLAGAERLGLQPKRRTAILIDCPPEQACADLPLVIDVDEQFYLKPDAGKLLISPANEDPEQPCDVQPDEIDIAICVDRIERAFNLTIRRIQSSWAGLRSFVADKNPVAGFSQRVEGFYWLAAQGGYGIQNSTD